MVSDALTCFKAYDIRGRIPDELNEDLAWRIGRAYAERLQPRTVAVGYDVRLSSPALTCWTWACAALRKSTSLRSITGWTEGSW